MIDTIIITDAIKGFPYHFFSGNDLVQISHCPNKRSVPTKVLKKQHNGRNGMCRGYFINRKFYSLTFLENRKYPIIKIVLGEEYLDKICPF